MATYTYKCEKCGTYEYQQSIHDTSLTHCVTCDNTVKKIYTTPNISGFALDTTPKYRPDRSLIWNQAQHS